MYQEQLDAFLAYEENIKTKIRKLPNPYSRITKQYLAQLVTYLSKIKLIRNEAGLVSMSLTLAPIKGTELSAAARIAFEVPRSKLMGGSAAGSAPHYAGLTPLLMLAHKEEHGVMYEEWDKGDKHIKLALGSQLQHILMHKDLPRTAIDIDSCREEYLGDKPATSWGGSKWTYGKAVLSASNPVTKMLLQTWIAHPSLRVENVMILDPWQWDAVPDSHDEVLETEEDPWGTPKPGVVVDEKKEEDIPW